MNPQQQTLWEWARESAREFEELIKPHVRGKLALSELPPAAPERMFEQIRRAREIHLVAEARLGAVDLILTNNRRRMVSCKRRKKCFELRLHHMFLDGDDGLVEDLLDFIEGDDGAAERVRGFIEENRTAIQHDIDPENLRTLGQNHDLQWILDGVKDMLADATLDDITITWGRRGRGRRSIRFGSYDFDQKLVRIHPALDKRWVPTYFLEYIVYHELLHALYPPTVEEDSSRRCVHTEEFKEMERRYPRYEDAIAWEAANIKHILEQAS